ncbi:MAG: CynX/NimT family MFS transporter [Solirubrobacteraceae bacterium]
MRTAPSRRLRPGMLLAAGIVLVAVNLRPFAASVGPLIGRIEHDTGLSSAGAGLLATVPVLCFGALAPLGSSLARRIGVQGALAVSLATLLVGLLWRLVPGTGFLFAGTVLASAAMAIGNVLLPVLVRSRFPGRVGTMTAIYSTALIAFSALPAAISVPVADALGGGWRPGLAIWALPTLIGLVAWLPALRGARPDGGGRAPSSLRHAAALLRSRVAVALTLFFALQSAGFYATLSWLPSIFESHGASAAQGGLLLGVCIALGLVMTLTVPGLATRYPDQRLLVAVFTATAAVGWLGVLVAPMAAPYLWVVVLGIGQNACFPLLLTMIVMRGANVEATAALSTFVQTIGYLLAAGAPVGLGALHGLAGSWTPAVVVLLALTPLQLLAGVMAGVNRRVSLPE